jgi:hypothetical protein
VRFTGLLVSSLSAACCCCSCCCPAACVALRVRLRAGTMLTKMGDSERSRCRGLADQPRLLLATLDEQTATHIRPACILTRSHRSRTPCAQLSKNVESRSRRDEESRNVESKSRRRRAGDEELSE